MSGAMTGRLLSVNVGRPRDVAWEGRTVRTAIWKDPVDGPRMVRQVNIEGDDQADRLAHGGEHRAVFVYQIDSYRYWEREPVGLVVAVDVDPPHHPRPVDRLLPDRRADGAALPRDVARSPDVQRQQASGHRAGHGDARERARAGRAGRPRTARLTPRPLRRPGPARST